MSATWVLVADRAKARLFAVAREDDSIVEIRDFLNPQGRASGRELSRDRPPTSHDRFGPGRHAIEPQTSIEQKTAESFARELDAVLEHGRVDRSYRDLVLIAPAHFLGTLNAALNKHVRACVAAELPKNLTSADAQTILAYLPH
jgi:protein required for attachment to host cells